MREDRNDRFKKKVTREDDQWAGKNWIPYLEKCIASKNEEGLLKASINLLDARLIVKYHNEREDNRRKQNEARNKSQSGHRGGYQGNRGGNRNPVGR